MAAEEDTATPDLMRSSFCRDSDGARREAYGLRADSGVRVRAFATEEKLSLFMYANGFEHGGINEDHEMCWLRS